MDTIIRPLHPDEYAVLDDFLYDAIFVPEGIAPPPREITNQPELRVYTEHFGRAHDRALIAEQYGQTVGAVWVRIMHDYGNIDDETPSFAVSLLPEFRGQGIGTALMTLMLWQLRAAGYPRASLAVQKENYAVKMYRALGFRTLRETDTEYIMVIDLQ